MVNWLLKKTRDAVTTITTAEVEALTSSNKVNIIFYGDITSAEGKIIANIANLDDFNSTLFVNKPIMPFKDLNNLREQSKLSDLLENQSQLKLMIISKAGSVLTKDPPFIHLMIEQLARFSAKDHQPLFSSSPLKLATL